MDEDTCIASLNIRTCLSDRVEKILSSFMLVEDSTCCCLTAEDSLIWKEITYSFLGDTEQRVSADSVILELTKPDDDCCETNQWIKSNCHLAKCILSVKSVYNHLSEDKLKRMESLLAWTRYEKIFLHCHSLLCDESNKCNAVLALLLLSSFLERALGNVYLLKGKQVPHLMKDLLATDELSSILGHEPVLILQALMGSPHTLNLRNLLWHGFVNPSEVDNRFGFFLFACAVSLQEQSCVDLFTIPTREAVTLTWHHQDFPGVEELDVDKLKEIFHQSPIVLHQMAPYWESALHLFANERFGESLVLLLPQLENCLRCIFVTLNHCQHRMLSAETSSLYTTFDEMLASHLPNGDPNKLRVVLGDNFVEMYLDILVYPEGPRVRDRVSHGETDLDSVPPLLVSHLLHLAAASCSLFLPKESSLSEDVYVHRLKEVASSYRSHFHPSVLLKNEVISLVSNLNEWSNNSPEPPEDVLPSLESMEFNSALSYASWRSFPGVGHSHTDNISEMLEEIQRVHPLTTFRPKSEKELVTILRQIAQHGCVCSTQVFFALENRNRQWLNRSLRSRQRLNYRSLLISTECIMVGLQSVVKVLSTYFVELNALSCLESAVFQKIMRFLRGVLQYVENLETLTNNSHNQWEESSIMTLAFIRLVKEVE